MLTHIRHRSCWLLSLIATCAVMLGWTPPAMAQGGASGTVSGTVTRRADGSRLSGASVSVQGTGISAFSGTDGRFTLQRVPAGSRTLLFRTLGYRPHTVAVEVTAGANQTVDVGLEAQAITLGEVVVEAPSRAPERVVEAPAAVAVVDQALARANSVTGQLPLALATTPGVDVVQSGVHDFNVNPRGFNSSLNRRVLVLQDGRDLALALLGAQEWNALSVPLEDMGRLEMVRGPGSALYGANAFSGVLDITTPTAREVVGTKLTLAGGELSTARGDLRHAGLMSEGRLGYRVNVGYSRSDTWTRSRTRLDGGDFLAEYAAATNQAVNRPAPGFELRPLNGQTRDAATGAATGERDPLEALYGTLRVDWYADNGSVATVDGGAAQIQNEVLVTGIGRVQITKAIRPWARLAWAAPHYNVMAWYSGRNSIEPQTSLGTGLALQEKSAILHLEGQFNQGFLQDRARVVMGASARRYQVDSKGTILAPADDDRSDQYYSVYGQVEYRPDPRLRLVATGRFDKSDLFDAQFSPRGGLVVSPNERHSFRLTVSRAFQVPNYSEFFLRLPVAPPTASPGTLERSLEGYFAAIRANFGADPTLPATPTDIPWDFDSLTPALALGNSGLDVEKVTAWEVGYKGNVSGRIYVGLDVFTNRLRDFVTDLLPAAVALNPDYPAYLLTDGGTDIPQTLTDVDAYLASRGIPATHPLRAAIPQLRGGYNQLDAALVQRGLLATLPGGQRAIVLSIANAGRVREQGVELNVGYLVSDELRVEGSYTFFNFKQAQGILSGDQVLPNTPKHKGTLTLAYSGAQGLDLNLTLRRQTAFSWAAGVFSGFVDWSQIVDVSAGYRVNDHLRVHAIATNVLDQQRFQMYGGSVIGRRVIAGVTATF
jgi:outer membrane receptor protein involved in Fe transport